MRTGVNRDFFGSTKETVLTVSELAARAKVLLEEEFALVRVLGEISDVSLASSGHAYFSLKDEHAVFPAVMFKMSIARIGNQLPPEGMQVEVLGRVTLYEPRGRTQLVVEWMAPHGEGKLSLQLILLRNKLQSEGLFDPARKRMLPFLPRSIGIVTSPAGAAIYDILKVLARRFPSIPVWIAPVKVQGEGAALQITKAVQRLGDGCRVDVLIVARGGGSAEDLSAFNDEGVVRAVSAAKVPVISAVGHEVDLVFCDLAADVRASTPTMAAEMVVPDRRELQKSLLERTRQMRRMMKIRLEKFRRILLDLSRQIRDPRLWLADGRLRLDDARQSLLQSVTKRISLVRRRLFHARVRLASTDPRVDIRQKRLFAKSCRHRLLRAIQRGIEVQRMHLVGKQESLSSLNPLAILSRGYSVVFGTDGKIVRSVSQAALGDILQVRLRDGVLDALVKNVKLEK
jgi:exodeoxyribonuclease VII large subunit